MRWRRAIGLVAGLLMAATLGGVHDWSVDARILARTTIPIRGSSLDIDARPDLDGIQNTLTAVKDFPTAVMPVLGAPGAPPPASLPPGAVVKADMTGPAFGDDVRTLMAAPNELMEIPPLAVSGDYALFNVRLEDTAGNVLLTRDRVGAPLIVTVIEKLLVTQVDSRALTLDEIREKGIVIDEENFTAVNFTVGLTLGSEEVAIEMPVIVPRTAQAAASVEAPRLVAPAQLQRAFDRINIPNFSLAGFQLNVPPQVQEEAGIELPPINGVIVIPGNIGFLNQFFSVILQASNVAPAGSGLTLRAAKATVALPAGGDAIAGSGDDPLRMAETQTGGVQTQLSLLGPGGDDVIAPQATNQAEFLVEGLREGTHQLRFDIAGDLFVPSLGKTLPMNGKAAGLIQVTNPTFSIVLAHPDVVREGEAYSLFATVTNTSTKPANLFRLALNGRSLSGARLGEGETGEKALEALAPGQAETLEFRMEARTTGEVTGTVFLADPSINGSFVLTTGVGDTGIPLSPDTLVLPDTVDYLPKDPDIAFQAIRLLGQAYSVATAPAGTLPPEIGRIGKGHVFERAVKLAQAGLHMRFGETPAAAARDILMDYLGSRPSAPAPVAAPTSADAAALDAVAADPALRQAVAQATAAEQAAGEAALDAAQQARDRRAFDALRRAADAGHDFIDVIAKLAAADVTTTGAGAFQAAWAGAFASRAPHVSFVAESEGAPVYLRLAAADKAVGRRAGEEETVRDLPFAADLTLLEQEGRHARMLLEAAPAEAPHIFEWAVADAAGLAFSVVLPSDADPSRMVRATYERIDVESAASGRMTWTPGGQNDLGFEIDSDGDGAVDRVLAPREVIAVADGPPRLLGVRQWAKGAQPSVAPSFEYGDPLGRMLGVFFSEEVDTATATDAANYAVADNKVLQVALQPDQRLTFLILDKPVGPFVARSLIVDAVVDLRGNAMERVVDTIDDAQERGVGGSYAGRVVTAAGEPVPFASVKYIQPVSKPSMYGGCLGSADVEDYVIATYVADAEGRFAVDYVLQSGFPTPDCPSNADVWLNETNPGGTLNFKLEALDPEAGEIGKASSRVHYDGQRLAFDVIIRGYGAIEGMLVQEDGAPVAAGLPSGPDGLYVYASNISTGERHRTWVDETGAYAFPNKLELPDGQALTAPKVTVGNVVLNVVRPADGQTAVTTVNLPAAGTTTTQDLIMMPPNRFGRVSGRVLEADGKRGAPNVLVQISGRILTGVSIYERTYGHGVIGSTYTDSEGRFAFEQTPTGDIEVRAFRQETYEQAAAKTALEAEVERTVTLLFPGSGGTVRGLVRDAFGQPVPNAKVAGGPTLTEADADGFFEIERLPLGRHRIYAQAPDAPALGKIEVQTLGPGDVQNVVVTLEPTGSIGGAAYLADGKTPAAGQKVQLWVEPDRGVIAEATADDGGGFAFEGYPVGQYSVRAIATDRGDGGMAFTAIRFAGDRRDADIVFRGLGSISGRVVQSNGTPTLTDVIVRRKVWRIFKDEGNAVQQAYREVIETVKAQSDERTAKQIDRMMQETGAAASGAEFFMLVDESKLLKSDISGPSGEVTGRFRFDHVLAGPFTVAAFGPFLAPAEIAGEVPARADATARAVDVGDVSLEPAVGKVRGVVYLPDGETPVGAGVVVRLRSLDSSGSVMTARGAVEQPVLPEIAVETDEAGQFEFPLVLRGRVVVTADTGVPAVVARAGADLDPTRFADETGERVLNVRLYGRAVGVAPAGEMLDLDIRLANAAAVRIKVVESDGRTPVPQAEVSLRTESVLDEDEEADLARAIADADGVIEFFPVIEGAFSVNARMTGAPARGRAAGAVPDRSPAGHEVVVTVQLGAVTTAAGEVIPADAFGSVEGVVRRASGAPLDNPAQITIVARGVRLLATTTDGGRYRVPDVPVGALVVEAFEPFTARRAHTEAALTRDGETVDVGLRLVGLGTVTGTVLSSDGQTPLGRVDVLLFPSGRFSDKLVTRSDPRGRYVLPGVPVGPYAVRIKDTETSLVGETRGLLRRDGQELTTDVRFEPSGKVSGMVYAAGVRLDEAGQPVDAEGVALADAPIAANASVTLRGSRFARTVQAGADGVYRSGAHLPLGRYDIAVRAADGKDGDASRVALTYDGEQAAENFVLAGRGTIEGIVRDSQGVAPVATAEVRLRSRSPYLPGEVTRFTDADGIYRFDGVPVGRFSLSVRRTIGETELGASGGGEIAAHGDVLTLKDDEALRLQPSGAVFGRAVLPDGETAAEGVIVALQDARISLGRRTGADGAFRFDGIPLGDYRLDLREPKSNAVARRAVGIAANGDVLDLGAVVLDGAPPRLLVTTPAADAANVAPSTPVTLTFSEPLDPTSVTSEAVRATVNGVAVKGKIQVAEDGLTVVFRQDAHWADLSLVQIEVRGVQADADGRVTAPGVADLAGRSLARDHIFSFATADATPPVLVAASPADGATGVPLRSVIRLEFSESLDLASISNLSLLANGRTVAGRRNEKPIMGGRVLAFAPAAALKPDTPYEVVIAGPVRDLAGNPTPEPALRLSFRTLDTAPPEIVALAMPSGMAPAAGRTVPFKPEFADPDDVALVEFHVGGSLVGAASTAPFAYPLNLGSAEGEAFVVRAVAVDAAGNRSAPFAMTLTLTGNQPPTAAIVRPADGQVSAGETVRIVVKAQDDVGLAQLALTAEGGDLARLAVALDGAQNAEHAFAFRVPPETPSGQTLTLQAFAEDTLGLVTEAATVTVTVIDRYPPLVRILEPARDAGIDPGSDLAVRVRATDASGLREIALYAAGVAVIEEKRAVAETETEAEATFALNIPADATAHDALTLTARAVDRFGNAGSREIALSINDLQPPKVALVTESGVAAAEPGQRTAVVVTAMDEIGVIGVGIRIAGMADQLRRLDAVAETRQRFEFALPPETPLGAEVSVEATATDRQGNDGVATLTLESRDLTGPRVKVTAPPRPKPGETFEVTVTARDRYGVAAIDLVVSDAVVAEASHDVSPAAAEATATFQVTVPADAASHAALKLTARARDVAGNDGLEALRWLSIADVVAPTVTEIAPTDGAVDVDVDVRVTASFSEAIATRTVSAESFKLVGPSGPVAGRFRFSRDRRHVGFQLDAPLAHQSEYRLELSTAVADAAGNGLPAPVAMRFVTKRADVIGPAVALFEPGEGAVGVPMAAKLRVAFDEPLVRRTVTPDAIALRGPDDEPMPLRFRLSQDRTEIAFEPQQRLKSGTEYRLALAATITDEAGNGITGRDRTVADAVELAFTTAALEITRPSLTDGVLEHRGVDLEIVEGPGMEVAAVQVEVLGRRLPRATVRPFRARFLAPPAKAGPDVPVVLVGLDAEGEEIARQSIRIPVRVALEGPALSGAPAGGHGRLELSVSAPLAENLPIAIASSDPDILRLEVDSVMLPAGARRIVVPLDGVAEGQARVTARSARGRVVTVVSVSPAAAGRPAAAASQPTAAAVKPAVFGGALWIPSPGDYDVAAPLPAGAAGEARVFAVTSSAPAVLAAPASATAPAGARLLGLHLTAKAEGVAHLHIRRGGASYIMSVGVGVRPPGRSLGVVSASAGAVLPSLPTLRPLVLSRPGAHVVRAVLLDAPAAAATRFAVVNLTPDLLGAPEVFEVPAGAVAAELALTALGEGEGALVLSADGQSSRLPVRVGQVDDAAIVAPTLSIAVSIGSAPFEARLHVARPGKRRVDVPFLLRPAARDRVVTLASADAAILSVPASTVIQAGATSASIELDAKQAGATILTLRSGVLAARIDVVVGSELLLAPTGRVAAPAGVAVLAAPHLGFIAFAAPGETTVRVPLPMSTTSSIDVASDEPAIAEVVSAAASGGMADLRIIAGAPGRARLWLTLDGVALALDVVVGEEAHALRSGAASNTPQMALRPVGVLGTVALAPNEKRTLRIPLSGNSAGEVASRNTVVVTVTDRRVGAGAEMHLEIVLQAGAEPGEAVVDVATGARVGALRIIVGDPGEGGQLNVKAPLVGVDIEE